MKPRLARCHAITEAWSTAAMGNLDGPPNDGKVNPMYAMANRVFHLIEQLREARAELASYSELLVRVHRSILPPRLPDVPGLDLAVHFAAAEQVGGDFYDVRPVGQGHWALGIADSCGHGLTAAAVMDLAHALGNASNGQTHTPSPGADLRRINGLLSPYLANTGRFLTAFVAFYDASSQVLLYASAGHPPPRLVRAGQVRRLDAVGGLPLGIEESSRYEEAAERLVSGDRVAFFTDGITDARSAQQEYFGDARFGAAITAPAATAAELLRHVTDELRAFRGDDDQTCLVGVVRPDLRG